MATKKTAAKKAVTKKRAYNRKPIQPSVKAQMELPLMNLDALIVPESEAPSNDQVLREIEVIDVRELDNSTRVTLLIMLADEGYISRSLQHLVNDIDSLDYALSSDGFHLDHDHKLVGFVATGDLPQGTSVAKPSVVQQIGEIKFFRPQTHSDVIEQAGALYARIG